MGISGLSGITHGSNTIKSIQNVSGEITNGNTTDNITISSVDTNNTILLGTHGALMGVVGHGAYAPRWYLGNSTTITLQSASAAGGQDGGPVNLAVIEFEPDVVSSMQGGSVAISSGSTNTTDTITSVNTSKSIIIPYGLTSSGSAGASLEGYAAFSWSFDNATTVRAEVNDSANTALSYTLYYNVVEFV